MITIVPSVRIQTKFVDLLVTRAAHSRATFRRAARPRAVRKSLRFWGAAAVGDYALIGSGENEGKQFGRKFGEALAHDSDGWHIVMLVGNSPPKP
jgi:hypothetical protein